MDSEVIEEIVDSHAVLRNNTKTSCLPFTQLPPRVISCKTIPYPSQDFDIDTVKTQNVSVIRIPCVTPSSLATSNLFSISSLLHFKMLYKWNCTARNPVGLTFHSASFSGESSKLLLIWEIIFIAE